MRGTITLDPTGAVAIGGGYHEGAATEYQISFGGASFQGGAGTGIPYTFVASNVFSVRSESIQETLPPLPAGATFGISFLDLTFTFDGALFDPSVYPQSLPLGQLASGTFDVGYYYLDDASAARSFSVRGEIGALQNAAAPVPEPGPLPLLALGLLGAAAARWARVRASA